MWRKSPSSYTGFVLTLRVSEYASRWADRAELMLQTVQDAFHMLTSDATVILEGAIALQRRNVSLLISGELIRIVYYTGRDVNTAVRRFEAINFHCTMFVGQLLANGIIVTGGIGFGELAWSGGRRLLGGPAFADTIRGGEQCPLVGVSYGPNMLRWLHANDLNQGMAFPISALNSLHVFTLYLKHQYFIGFHELSWPLFSLYTLFPDYRQRGHASELIAFWNAKAEDLARQGYSMSVRAALLSTVASIYHSSPW